MAITYVGAGTGAAGTGALTGLGAPTLPIDATIDDLLILLIEGEGEDADADAPPTGGDWTLIGSIASAITSEVDRTRASAYWAWYDAAINRDVPDAGDHAIARIYAFRGVDTTTPFDVATVSGFNDVNTTSHSAVTGQTSVTDGAMAILPLTLGDNVGVSAEANANLASVGHTGVATSSAGSDGCVTLLYGIRTVAGPIGTWSWTAGSTETAWHSVVLRDDGYNFTLVTPTTITADSNHASGPPSYAVDGNLTGTYWSSDNTSTVKWLKADLGSAKKIGRARFHTQSNTNVYEHSLEYSYDDSTWHKVPLGYTYFPSNPPKTADEYFPIIEARYWRWICVTHGGSPSAAYHRIWEVELYEDADGVVGRAPTLERAGEHIIRPNRWANANIHTGAGRNFDGSLTTEWISNNMGAGGVMATLDWGLDVPITKVRWYKADGVNGVVTTWEGSDNESDWVTIAAAQASPAAGTWTTVDLDPAVQYRYWRWKQDVSQAYPRFQQVEFYTTGAAMTDYLDGDGGGGGDGGGLMLMGVG